MNQIVPPSFLFDYRLPLCECPEPSNRRSGRLLDLPARNALFQPSRLNQPQQFAELRMGWNEGGLGLLVKVEGKRISPSGSSADIKRSDCVLLWIDTRPTGNVHRATEYCNHIACLPVDEHQDESAAAISLPIAQQRAQRTELNAQKVGCRTHISKTGYELEIWIPGEQLHGYREVTELGRIGFYAVVQDSELGDQPLSIQEDFPINYDPSTWIQLELQK